MAFQDRGCHHPMSHRSSGLCLSCVSEQLRDDEGLPIQQHRIMETLHHNLALTFSASSSKAKRHYWGLLLPGLLSALRRHSDHLKPVGSLITEHFHPEDILSFVVRSLVFNLDSTSPAAVCVTHVLSVAAQRDPDLSVQLLQDEQVTQFMVASIFRGNEATTEAALYCAWVLLGNEWALHQCTTEEAVDERADLRFNHAVCTALSEHLSRVCELLQTRVPAQLRMNLIGLLTRLVLQQSSDGSNDALIATIIDGERPPALRRLLLCMVQDHADVAAAATMLLTNFLSVSDDAHSACLKSGVLDFICTALRSEPEAGPGASQQQRPFNKYHMFVFQLFLSIVCDGHAKLSSHDAALAFKISSDFLAVHMNNLPFVTLFQSVRAVTASVFALEHFHDSSGGHVRGVDIVSRVCTLQLAVFGALERAADVSTSDAVAFVDEMMQCLAVALAKLGDSMHTPAQTMGLLGRASQCFNHAVAVVRSIVEHLGEGPDKHEILACSHALFDVAEMTVRFLLNRDADVETLHNVEWVVFQVLESMANWVTNQHTVAPGALALLVVFLEAVSGSSTEFPFGKFVDPFLAVYSHVDVALQPQILQLLQIVGVSSGHAVDSTTVSAQQMTLALVGLRGGALADIARHASVVVASARREVASTSRQPAAVAGSLHFLAGLLCAQLCGSGVNCMAPLHLSANDAAHVAAFASSVVQSSFTVCSAAEHTCRLNNVLYLLSLVTRHDVALVSPAAATRLHSLLTPHDAQCQTTPAGAQHPARGQETGADVHNGLLLMVALPLLQRDARFGDLVEHTLQTVEPADFDMLASTVAALPGALAVLVHSLRAVPVLDATQATTALESRIVNSLDFFKVVLSKIPATQVDEPVAQDFLGWTLKQLSVHRAQRAHSLVVAELSAVQRLLIQQKRSYGCATVVVDVMLALCVGQRDHGDHGRMSEDAVKGCLGFIASTLLVLAGEERSGRLDKTATSPRQMRHVLASRLADDLVVRSIFLPNLERLMRCANDCSPELARVALECVVACAQFTLQYFSDAQTERGDRSKEGRAGVRRKLVRLLPTINTHGALAHMLRSAAPEADKLLALQLVGVYAQLHKVSADFRGGYHQSGPLLPPRSVYGAVVRFAQTLAVDERSELLHNATNKLVFILFALSRSAPAGPPRGGAPLTKAADAYPNPATPAAKGNVGRTGLQFEQSGTVSGPRLGARGGGDPGAGAAEVGTGGEHGTAAAAAPWTTACLADTLFGNVWFEFTFRGLMDVCRSCLTWSTPTLQLLTIFIAATKDAEVFSCHIEVSGSDQLNIFASLERVHQSFVKAQRQHDAAAVPALRACMLAHVVVFLLLFNSPEYTSPAGLEDQVYRWLGHNQGSLTRKSKWESWQTHRTTGAVGGAVEPSIVVASCQRWPCPTQLFCADETLRSDATAGRTRAKREMKMKQLLQSLADPAQLVGQFATQSHGHTAHR